MFLNGGIHYGRFMTLAGHFRDGNEGFVQMLKQVVAVAVLAVTGGQAMAELQSAPGNHWNQGGVVVVQCFRGPWREVIWDHPEAQFTESLVAVGYDYPSALSIANRICRDITLVDDDAALKAAMERIIAEAPGY